MTQKRPRRGHPLSSPWHAVVDKQGVLSAPARLAGSWLAACKGSGGAGWFFKWHAAPARPSAGPSWLESSAATQQGSLETAAWRCTDLGQGRLGWRRGRLPRRHWIIHLPLTCSGRKCIPAGGQVAVQQTRYHAKYRQPRQGAKQASTPTGRSGQSTSGGRLSVPYQG